MDLPTVTVAHDTRQANQHLQQTPGERNEERETTIPRMTTRASASGTMEIAPQKPAKLVSDIGEGNVEPKYGAPANSGAEPVSAIEIMDLDKAMAYSVNGILPLHFSVPYAAIPHLVLFGNALVSLENAAPDQLACLVYRVIRDRATSETLKFSCVQHLFSLGMDPSLDTYKSISWPQPLFCAVSTGSFKLVSLLLEHGARPKGSYEMVDIYSGGMNIDIVRTLLKAGADPWQSIGRPEQLPTDGRHVSIAAFYEQTGLNINAESDINAWTGNKLTPLEMAHSQETAHVLTELLNAGAYAGDVIRFKFQFDAQNHVKYFGSCTIDTIASYRTQRAFLPCGFSPYALLHETLQAGPPAAIATSYGTSTTTTSTAPASGATLAQASLAPACNALIDGHYSAAAVARLVACLNNMPPAFSNAVVQALALARLLGHYSADQGAEVGEFGQGIGVALFGAGLWDKYLTSKTRFETLQANIDRHQADGRTLLTTAAANGKIRMIRVLVKLGARVNYPDAHGNYPLLAAASARKPDTCSALLALGANAGTSDPLQRSTLFHVANWLAQTDVRDTAGLARVIDLVEQLFRLGYDFRQPTPEDHADHAAYPTVADLLFKPENCVKVAVLGQERTGKLVQAMLFNVSRRGSQPFLNGGMLMALRN